VCELGPLKLARGKSSPATCGDVVICDRVNFECRKISLDIKKVSLLFQRSNNS
jgi:hypothetical protein